MRQDAELAKPVGSAVGGDDQSGAVEGVADEGRIVDLAGEGDDDLHSWPFVSAPPSAFGICPRCAGGERIGERRDG